MRPKSAIFSLSFSLFIIFTIFSYTVAKEWWMQVDFDTTVKIQDRIPRKFDEFFSLFSFLGSAEVTFAIATILAVGWLIRKKWLASLGWILIIPATIVTVIGKLLVFHPAPPNFFLRTVDLENDLPRFYVHSEYSYPSGHTTRTIFLLTALAILIIFSKKSFTFKVVSLGILGFIGFMMSLTRIYLGEHWLSDVLGGMILGASAGSFASLFILKKPN